MKEAIKTWTDRAALAEGNRDTFTKKYLNDYIDGGEVINTSTNCIEFEYKDLSKTLYYWDDLKDTRPSGCPTINMNKASIEEIQQAMEDYRLFIRYATQALMAYKYVR